MKIAVLSRQSTGHTAKRLRAATEERGHTLRIFDTLKFSIGLEREEPALYYRNRSVGNWDAVIPRIGASVTFFGLAVLRQFEQLGVYTPNESIAIARSRDKLRSMQILSRHEIGIPATAFVRDRRDILAAIERIGGAPVIIKVLEGTQGVGVILAESVKIAEAIIETLHGAKQNVLIQKFVKESKGRDVRAFVVGDRVVAAMRRIATGEEFRSNVHRGGNTEAVSLSDEFERTAIRAAQIMGLRVAGVDMLEADDGPQVMEVNSSPGLEGIETVTKIDIAGAIIDDIEQQVLFPEFDLRQRMRMAGGHSIGEFTVHDMPTLEGKTLRNCPLAELGIHVISIDRQSQVIPNPDGDTEIHAGDTLVCYGPREALQGLMPPRKPRKRKARRRKSAG